MCMIVDANRLHVVLVKPPAADAAPIHRWLATGRGVLVYSTGGGFADEVGERSRRRLREYAQAGRARLIAADAFRDDETRLRKDDAVRSDDPHVLALARFSGARLLYTGDQALMKDFKNKRLIDGPRGKIYTGHRNARLLTASTCPRYHRGDRVPGGVVDPAN